MSRKISVDLTTRIDTPDYLSVVDDAADALIYHTAVWLDFLTDVLTNAEPVLFIACEEGLAVGVLPTFVMRGRYGAVLNSLPYFGSHGDIVISQGAKEPLRVMTALVHELDRFRKESNIEAINVVAHPLAPHFGTVAMTTGLAEWDTRIGQISRLSPASTREDALEQVLSACHGRARNTVRKALNQDFRIDTSDDEADWNALIKYHALGMRRIGGYAKNVKEFAALRLRLKSGTDRRLYIARQDGGFIGGLLCLYYRHWVYYFTPVTVEAARAQEVGRALIAEALVEACLEGRRFWNWGGTWKSQAGVYQFKRGWGADDHIYGYHGAVTGHALKAAGPSEVIASYPHFYIRPFAVTQQPTNEGRDK
jgi:hypothetical protein